MPKENPYFIPKENKKPTEIVAELKNEYQIPSFEEFMKTYQNDGKVNYDDLNSADIGTQKGYGPTTYGQERYIVNYKGRDYEHEPRFFILLEAEWGVDGQWFFGIPTRHSPKRSIDSSFGSEARRFMDSVSREDYEMSGIWQSGTMRWKVVLIRPSQAEEMLKHFASGGLKVRGRGNVHHRGAQNDIINTLNTALETYRNGGNVRLIGRKF